MKYETVKNYYNGTFRESATTESLDVVSPVDGNLLSTVPMSTADELNAAGRRIATADNSTKVDVESSGDDAATAD